MIRWVLIVTLVIQSLSSAEETDEVDPIAEDRRILSTTKRWVALAFVPKAILLGLFGGSLGLGYLFIFPGWRIGSLPLILKHPWGFPSRFPFSYHEELHPFIDKIFGIPGSSPRVLAGQVGQEHKKTQTNQLDGKFLPDKIEENREFSRESGMDKERKPPQRYPPLPWFNGPFGNNDKSKKIIEKYKKGELTLYRYHNGKRVAIDLSLESL